MKQPTNRLLTNATIVLLLTTLLFASAGCMAVKKSRGCKNPHNIVPQGFDWSRR